MAEIQLNAAERERYTVRSEEEKKALYTRLNKIIGQMNGVKRMVEEDRYCEDIITQLSAVDKSVKSLVALLREKEIFGHRNDVRGVFSGNRTHGKKIGRSFRLRSFAHGRMHGRGI